MKNGVNKTVIKVIIHIITWLLLFGLPLNSSRLLRMGNDFLLLYYTFSIINCLIFYTNYLFLVPEFFFQKRRYKYFLAAIMLVISFYYVSDFSGKRIFSHMSKEGRERFEMARNEGRPLPAHGPPSSLVRRLFTSDAHAVGYLSSASLMIFLSLGLKVLERQSKIEKLQEEMEKSKLNAELAFLKNQISPHFFFNTLNNIYSLIGINAEDSQKAVLKLSKLMRYLLYESEHGDTKLSNEIDFMKNYIDLMKLRMSEKVSLAVDFPEAHDDISIPPLLFIPFIENAFKHGVTTRGRSFINISLSFTAGLLAFKCTNSISGNGEGDSQPGIGLGNVKKRLALLFPGKHDLVIDKHDDEFRVFLNIILS